MAISTEGESLTASTYMVPGMSAGNGVKGSYTQITASSSQATNGFIFHFRRESNALYLLDLATGASGAETVIISNLIMQNNLPSMLYVPLSIPSGTRIAVRGQANSNSNTARCGVTLVSNSYLGATANNQCTTYGADTSTTRGVQVDPGATVNTKGSYSEIVSSTTNPIKQLVVLVGFQARAVTSGLRFLLDIATGGAGSESVLLSNLGVETIANNIGTPATFGPFPVDIPAGTRFAARAQSTTNDAAQRLFDVIILGFD